MAWPKGKPRKVKESWRVSDRDWKDFTRVWNDREVMDALSGVPEVAQRRWPIAAVLFLLWRWALEGGRKSFEGALEACWPILRALFANKGEALKSLPVTSTALGYARELIGSNPFEKLMEIGTRKALERFDRLIRWKKWRLWALDGTTLRVFPSSSLRKEFGGPSTSRGRTSYPCMRFVGLDLVHLGWIAHARMASYDTPEIAVGRELTACLGPGDFLLADRGFFCTGWLWWLQQRGVHFLIRLGRLRHTSIHPKDQKALNALRKKQKAVIDKTVTFRVSENAHKLYPDVPDAFSLRYIEIARPRDEPLILITTLPRSDLSVKRAGDLYRQRWEEETEWRYFKGADHLNMIQSRKPGTVRQEVLLHVMAHNGVRWAQAEACMLPRGSNFSPSPSSPTTRETNPEK